MKLRNSGFHGITALLLGVGALAGGLAFAACSDAPVKNPIPPAGVLRGQFLYSGPPPCTEKGRIVGAGIILVFDQRLLPPPDGLATRSARVKVVPGDQLFAEAAKTLTYSTDGSRVCPAPGTKNIFASAGWDLSPLETGNYQIRAFYDLDGDFHPAFRFANLPTKGDITGGSIDNITEALQGKAPVFTNIRVGVPDGNGSLVMPETGVLVDNLTVAVALPASLQRPYFHVTEVQAGKVGENGTPPAPVKNPTRTVMPADYHIGDSNPINVQPYLWVMKVEAGVAQAEREIAKANPFFMKIDDPGKLPVFWFDANRDGKTEIGADHVIGSNTAPSLAPLISLTKLDPTDPIKRNGQVAPRVLSSAVVMSTGTLVDLLSFTSTTPVLQNEIWAAVRPTAVCIPDANDAEGETNVVTPFELTLNGAPTIGELDLTISDIAVLLRRKRDKVRVIYACLPPGELAMNLINLSGQAWTIPNESGVCLPGEPETQTDEGLVKCGTRAKLASQNFIFEVGPASNPQACNDAFAKLSDDLKRRFRTNCLRPDEQKKLDEGTLWSPNK